MITLPEARELREQLSPAFAGYVTDGNISDRDVLATLMDLIVRGYIGIDADTQKKPVKVRKIYFVKTSERLLPFEKKFIGVLFKEKKELGVEEAKGIIDSKVLHEVIKQNTDALTKSKIAKSLVVFFDKNDKVVDLSYEKLVTKKVGFLQEHREYVKEKPKTIGDLERLIDGTKLGVFFIFAFGFFWFYIYIVVILLRSSGQGGIEVVPSGFVPLDALVFGIIILLYFLYFGFSGIRKVKKLRKLNKLLVLQFTNNIIPFTKKKYEELFEFIQKYPLRQQRLYNEFMPHAVAFGLDTSWNESFGIPEEVVIESRAKRHLPDKIKQKISDSDFVEHK